MTSDKNTPAAICLEFVKTNSHSPLLFAEIRIVLPLCESQEKQAEAVKDLKQWITSEAFWLQTDQPIREFADQARSNTNRDGNLRPGNFQRCG